MNEKLSAAIGSNLEKLRLENYNSKIEIAMEINVSPSQYGRIEKGSQMLTCDGLKKLCDFYGEAPEYILFGETLPKHYYFFRKIQDYSESQKRRILRTLYLHTAAQRFGEKEEISHRLFGTDLLNRIPWNTQNVIPYLLDFEMKQRELTKQKMQALLGLSKGRFYQYCQGEPVADIKVLLSIHDQLGYDLTFLLMNRLRPNCFFDNICDQLAEKEKEKIYRKFDLCLSLENIPELYIERQNK